MEEIILFLQLLISIIFFSSGIIKFFSFKSFVLSIIQIGIHNRLAPFIALLIASAEIILSVFILIPSTQTIAIILLFPLLFSFMFVTIVSLKKNLKVKCNCFGKLSDEKIGYSTLVRCFLLLIINIILYFNLSSNDIESLEKNEIILITTSSLGMFLIYLLIVKLKDAISD